MWRCAPEQNVEGLTLLLPPLRCDLCIGNCSRCHCGLCDCSSCGAPHGFCNGAVDQNQQEIFFVAWLDAAHLVDGVTVVLNSSLQSDVRTRDGAPLTAVWRLVCLLLHVYPARHDLYLVDTDLSYKYSRPPPRTVPRPTRPALKDAFSRLLRRICSLHRAECVAELHIMLEHTHS